MNYQWVGQTEAMPVVEFHDVRAENDRADAYLGLIEGPLAAPFAEAGGGLLGQFRVAGHTDRVMLLRGYAGMPERRRTIEMYLKSAQWQANRASLLEQERQSSVILTRTLMPSSATRPLRLGEGCTAIVSELRFADQIGTYHLWLRLFLRKAGLDPLAAYSTLESVNDVPAVPVIKNRTHHIALVPDSGGVPQLPAELRGMLRYAPEILSLAPAPSLVW